MRFVESVAITFTSRIIIVLIAVASSIITARWLGPAGKGTFAVLWVIVGLGVQFGNFGFHASNVYFTARDKKLVSEVASISLCFGLIAGIIISSGLVGLYLIESSLFVNIPFLLLLVTIISIPFKLILYFFQHLFLGLQKILVYNSFELTERTFLFLVVAIVLVFFKRGLFSLMLFMTLVAGISALFYIIYTHNVLNSSFLDFDGKLFGKMFKYGFKSYLACIFGFLIVRSDMLLVNYFKGANLSGIYSVAVNLADFLYLLPVSIGSILFTKVSANIADEGIFTQKISRHAVLLMTIICILIALISKSLILLMYGVQFAFSATPFLWLLPGIFFLSLATIYNNDLAGRGLPPIVFIAPGVGFILNFSLNLLFIPRYGITGAAITSSISYFVMFMILLIYLVRFTHSTIKKFLVPNREEINLLLKRSKKWLKIKIT